VGPLVDAIHNQCLLEYDILPFEAGPVHTSLLIPPLLGIAYVVLGGILPGVSTWIVENIFSEETKELNDDGTNLPPIKPETVRSPARTSIQKAALAVASTVVIIKLSEILQTSAQFDSKSSLFIMATAAFFQWIVLDGTLPSLLAATVTALGGPLSELPFVASGCWHYLDSASDYFPLSAIGELIDNAGLSTLALSSITGPCYFAVTMDAIALRRYFDDN